MVHRKEEYTVDGIEVTIQQVRGPDSSMGASEPSAWLNSGAAYATNAIEAEAIPFSLSGETPYDRVKQVVNWMVEEKVRFCKKCENFRHVDNFVSTGFAGRKCQECANKDATCTDGGEHTDKCLNPRQKHNARVATKYKCEKCGRKRATTPTG